MSLTGREGLDHAIAPVDRRSQAGRFNSAPVFVLLSGSAICAPFLSSPCFRDAVRLTGWANRAAHRRSHRL
jgi:hypothetical protein